MIKLQNISFAYKNGENDIGIHDINLEIKQGEVIVLCGESGCGKTTVTRLLNGLIPNYYEGELKGTLSIKDKDMTRADIYDFVGIVGSVFQNPSSQFFCVETTDELAFTCENLEIPTEEIHKRMGKAISAFSITDLMDKSLFNLSGGEKQKIACASVSVMEPDIYVLDEPSSNLDIRAIGELCKVVEYWKNQGKTIIIAEHRLYWLTELADKFIFMKDGYIESEFSNIEFLALSENQRHGMGLRSLNPTFPDNLSVDRESATFIEFKDFYFAYKKKPVLDIKSLKVPQNAIVGILGNNGAGKSSFAKCLCGLEKKSKGILQLENKTMGRKERISHCYMVMQDVNHQLFTESVFDEILLSMDEENIEEQANKVLVELNLADKRDIHPMSLSGGEKQRVAIASAIVTQKPIIIFDEPTSGLDYRHMLKVSEQIKNLHNQGRSIFIISHDPELIAECCDYFIFIEKGQVEWSGGLNVINSQRITDFFEI